MGKTKRGHNTKSAKQQHTTTNRRRQHSQVLPAKPPKKPTPSKATTINSTEAPRPSTNRPRIPFTPNDRILLLGEGDFSFALSLVRHHRPAAVTATCYDSREGLVGKYPGVMETLRILDGGVGGEENVDVGGKEDDEERQEEAFEGFSPPPTARRSSHPPSSERRSSTTESSSPPPISNSKSDPLALPSPSQLQTHPATPTRILFSIDATKLLSHRKTLLHPPQTNPPQNHHHPSSPKYTPFTKIVFNFPHTGGISTDVNRQVRANQELLVKFLEGAKCLLQIPLPGNQRNGDRGDHNGTANSDSDGNNGRKSECYDTPPTSASSEAEDEDEDEKYQHARHPATTTPQILLTLFEGHPYTLWNVRDLARHAGYVVKESFRFPWESYPGYRHARTIGDIVSKGDREYRVDDADDGGGGGGGSGADAKEIGAANNSKKGGKKKKGRWHGEDREARTYVLELREHQDLQQTQIRRPVNGGGRITGKRKRGGGDRGGGSDDDSD